MDKQVLISLAAAEAGVLCSVVRSSGSVPRSDYPLMLLEADSNPVGTIGGGNLEFQVLEAAHGCEGEIELLEFDLNGADVSAERGLCGGNITVLLEPVTPSLTRWGNSMLEILESGNPASVEVDIHLGKPPRVVRKIHPEGRDPAAKPIRSGQRLRQFIPVDVLPRVIIFGAGHVGSELALQARRIGLDVTVYDDREDLLDPERLPYIKLKPLMLSGNWQVPPYRSEDYVVLASRSHHHDHALLERILQNPPAYLGALASRRKWKLMREDLLAQGFDEDQLGWVHSPVGLDIGSQTVPEIAVSILAEIIAHYRKDRRHA